VSKYFYHLVLSHLLLLVCATINCSTDSRSAKTRQAKTEAKTECAKGEAHYDGKIQHIFFHPLIIDTKKAFKNGQINQTSLQYADDWFVTRNEFKLILDHLYKENFVLAYMENFYRKDHGGFERNEKACFPEGKKPLIVSIDDLNYYPAMRMIGTSRRLIIDEKENLSAEIISEGKIIQNRDLSIITIMEDFISEHPDFSYNNAKGIIALTGYFGLFGYYDLYKKDNTEAVGTVKKIVQKIKENGWEIASHTYCHIDVEKINLGDPKKPVNNCNDIDLVNDLRLWKERVEPLIGKVNILVLPFGTGIATESPGFKYLQEHGFDLFYGVGLKTPVYTGTVNKKAYLFQQRVPIDGLRLKDPALKIMKQLFANTAPFIDPDRWQCHSPLPCR